MCTLSYFVGNKCRLVVHAASPQELVYHGTLCSCSDGEYYVACGDGKRVDFLAQIVVSIITTNGTVVIETR